MRYYMYRAEALLVLEETVALIQRNLYWLGGSRVDSYSTVSSESRAFEIAIPWRLLQIGLEL